METSQVSECTITIAFAGLFFFRQEEGGGEIKVGVLRGIPDHSLRIAYSGAPIHPATCVEKEWFLRVADKEGRVRENACLRRSGSFDRRRSDNSDDDYRWMISFADLHGNGYDVDEEMLFPEVHIPFGEAYTLCRTISLNHTIGGVPQGPFGSMADITGVDITLNADERLVLQTRDGQDIIPPIGFVWGTTSYIAFLNLPPDEMLGMPDRHLTTHFQNYYLLISEPFVERYDFQLPDEHGDVQRCALPHELMNLLPAVDKKKRRSPPPYYCGTAGG